MNTDDMRREVGVDLTDAPVVGEQWTPTPFTPDHASMVFVRRDTGWELHRVSVSGRAVKKQKVASMNRVYVRWVAAEIGFAPEWVQQLVTETDPD